MKIVHCPNTPDGKDYDVWDGDKLAGRFETMKAAETFIEEKTKRTLAEMHLEITEGIFPAITFNHYEGKKKELVSSTTIMWARFREVPDMPEIWEVRSNDSDTEPRQIIYITRNKMERYILKSEREGIHYTFAYYGK